MAQLAKMVGDVRGIEYVPISFAVADDLAYWEETLNGAPELLELPSDRPRPSPPEHSAHSRWKISLSSRRPWLFSWFFS